VNCYPESYLAPPEVRQRRERTRYRMALSLLRTGVKNRVQAILHRFGILHDFSDLFGKAGRRFLEGLELPEGSRQALKGYLDVLDVLTRLIGQFEQWMKENLEEDEIVRLLTSIPGIGLILAHVIRSEIGEIERFPTFRHLASYDGLAPMSDDTAGRKSSAKVAVAHELSKLVYVVWTKRVPYTDTPPPRPGSREGRRETKESPIVKTTLRSDQPRHPMVRRRETVGQTRS